MRILLDYRPALRQRTGVGEFVHQLARELATGPDELTVFSASWKNRIEPRAAGELAGARLVDRRIPVRLLNAAWWRLGWPPVERLCGERYDLVHSPNPTSLPTIGAASVVTIHDLDFLDHPEHTWGEMRHFPAAARVAGRADAVVVPSQAVARQVTGRLGIPDDSVFVCPHGLPPGWTDGLPAGETGRERESRGHILFVGTLTARKNIGGLLEAYLALLEIRPDAPALVLAGLARPESQTWLARLERPPLAGRARHLGYVADDQRRALYLGASMLVLPSFDEGFGLPVLEAMALGVPVVVSPRGALPELAGDAALSADPDQPVEIARAMAALLSDPDRAVALGEAGRRRAAGYSWRRSATLIRQAYAAACGRRARQCERRR